MCVAILIKKGFITSVHPQNTILIPPHSLFCLFLVFPVPFLQNEPTSTKLTPLTYSNNPPFIINDLCGCVRKNSPDSCSPFHIIIVNRCDECNRTRLCHPIRNQHFLNPHLLSQLMH